MLLCLEIFGGRCHLYSNFECGMMNFTMKMDQKYKCQILYKCNAAKRNENVKRMEKKYLWYFYYPPLLEVLCAVSLNQDFIRKFSLSIWITSCILCVALQALKRCLLFIIVSLEPKLCSCLCWS